MTAIITDRFRFANLTQTLDKHTDEVDRFYLGIGRAEPWENDNLPPIPTITHQNDLGARHSLQSIKKITDIVPCAPRYNWKIGETYVAYDDNDEDLHNKKYYVINTANFNVYLCLKAGAGSSTVEPLGLDDNDTGLEADQGVATLSAGADGYIWKYMYTISAVDALKYLTTDFMPVFKNSFVASNTTHGAIFNTKVVEQGVGYSSAPTVTIEGDGTGATATASVSGGLLTSINMTAFGSGYTYAKVSLSGGSPTTAGTARAIVSPVALGREIEGISVTAGGSSYTNGAMNITITGDGREATATATVIGGAIQDSIVISNSGYNYTQATAKPEFTTAGTEAELTVEYTDIKGGFGYNPIVDMNAYYLMFNIVLEGDENPLEGFQGDFIPANNYRQLMIIKNPLDVANPQTPFTETTGYGFYTHTVAASGTWVLDDEIIGVSSGARGIIDYYDSNTETLFYHQNDNTGFNNFINGETLNAVGVSSGVIVTANQSGEFDKYSGNIQYIENRVAVSRAADQTEDIKLVLQF